MREDIHLKEEFSINGYPLWAWRKFRYRPRGGIEEGEQQGTAKEEERPEAVTKPKITVTIP